MSTAAVSTESWSRAAGAARSAASRSVPPPLRLTADQERELESELRRELAALERRIVNESQSDAADSSNAAMHGGAAATQRMSDADLRRDAVAAALARLAAGTYGTCSHCGEPIPFGRLLVMPEATHCLACSARA